MCFLEHKRPMFGYRGLQATGQLPTGAGGGGGGGHADPAFTGERRMGTGGAAGPEPDELCRDITAFAHAESRAGHTVRLMTDGGPFQGWAGVIRLTSPGLHTSFSSPARSTPGSRSIVGMPFGPST